MSRGRLGRVRARAVALAVLALATGAGGALAGCGTTHQLAGDRIHGHVLTIYTSLPLVGLSRPGAVAVLDAEQLALSQAGGRVGPFRVVLRVLNDATAARGRWDPGQASVDVHLAVQDPTTIGYLGDFDSGATAVSIPPLNRVGIPQISPMASAVGLTSNGPGSSPGEPAKYYPTGRRTFIALAPDDAVQARVQIRLQRGLGCRRTFVLYDEEDFDGYDAAAAFQDVAQDQHFALAGTTGFDPRATDYRSLALTVGQTSADCLVVSAQPSAQTALLTRQLAAALPAARLFGIGDLAEPAYAQPAAGGLPLALDPRVLIVSPGPGDGSGAARFEAAYRSRYGSPGPFAVYGYEAMRLLLSAIARATDGGRRQAVRSQVLSALFDSEVSEGALGPFTIGRNGSSSLTRCAVYRLVGGRLVLWFQTGG